MTNLAAVPDVPARKPHPVGRPALTKRWSARLRLPALVIVIGLLPLPAAAFLHATTAGSGSGGALYIDHCAACHGANLEGAPNWQSRGPDGRFPAPPHDETGHTWHHGDAMLFDYTRRGGQAFLDDLGVEFESGMPGFGESLSDAEIEAILAYIRSTWPERMREFQAARTAAETVD